MLKTLFYPRDLKYYTIRVCASKTNFITVYILLKPAFRIIYIYLSNQKYTIVQGQEQKD